METSPLPVKVCLNWTIQAMLGTHGHWAVRVINAQHPLWHGASIHNGHPRGPMTLTPIAERLAVKLSLTVFTTKVCRGWDSNTQQICLRYDSSNPLRHRRGCFHYISFLLLYIHQRSIWTFYSAKFMKIRMIFPASKGGFIWVCCQNSLIIFTL